MLNYGSKGCKAKCPTCPQTVSGPNTGPYECHIFDAFNKLRFSNEKIPFSLQSDIGDISYDLEKLSLNLAEIDYSVGCNIKFPLDATRVRKAFEYLESTIPNIKLELFLENRGFLRDYKKDLGNLVELFSISKLTDLSIACHNNSIRTTVFDQKIDELFQATTSIFKEILDTYPSDNFQKSLEENLFQLFSKDYKQFQSNLQFNFSSKKLRISERLLSFDEEVSGRGNLIDFYKDYFIGELRARMFTKDKIKLAFTSIGVRVNHRSIDIRNPYLWLSYDEFFELLQKAKSMNEFCFNLESSMTKTLSLSFEKIEIHEITHQTICALSDARRNIVR